MNYLHCRIYEVNSLALDEKGKIFKLNLYYMINTSSCNPPVINKIGLQSNVHAVFPKIN